MADELRDVYIDENRQVQVGADGDLRLTSGIGTVEQSVSIGGANVLRPLIGEPIDDDTFHDIEAELFEILDSDPQIEEVTRVEITEVNRSTGTVSVQVFTRYNNDFNLDVDV